MNYRVLLIEVLVVCGVVKPARRICCQSAASPQDSAGSTFRRESKSARADQLRASLKQSTDQLLSEIKTLLTPQQRDQFDRRIQKLNRHSPGNQHHKAAGSMPKFIPYNCPP